MMNKAATNILAESFCGHTFLFSLLWGNQPEAGVLDHSSAYTGSTFPDPAAAL